jgi:Domain of unknown function (DUF4913)
MSAGQDGGITPGQDAPEPLYPGVESWVTGQFLPVYRRPLGGEYRWCRRWWEHAEAIIRLTALWHSWEALRLEPGTGMASWLRDHLDHQMPVLMGRAGPFAMCSEDEHIQPREARARLAPPGWWEPADTGIQPGPEPGSPANPYAPGIDPAAHPDDVPAAPADGGSHDDIP